ncbi:MAG TPA: carbohydrate ABC transporter permease [Micromonosporaceae bacterium]|nr:carbohydrate ABC transporter permease [Micromonosporaceae bacterium]
MSTISATRRPATSPAPRRTSRRSPVPRIVWHLVCAALLLIMLYPVVWLLSMSVKPTTEIIGSISIIPKQFAPENYTEAFRGLAGVSVWQFLTNSLTVSILAVIGNVVACSLAAYAFARLRFRLRAPLFAFMIATIMLPTHVVLIPQYTIFNHLGLVGTFVPLILPKFLAVDAFFVFLMVQFMRGLPAELGDAARIDGAGPIRIFWSVILPLTRPAIITTSIFTFIWTWNDFLSQVIYLNDPQKYTLPMALSLYIDQQSQDSYGAMMAMSVLTLVPIGAFFFAFQRYLVEGVSTSGMGGA